MRVISGLCGVAGNMREIADSDFLGRDLTDSTDSKFDGNADLRGIGKGYQLRVRAVREVRGNVYPSWPVARTPPKIRRTCKHTARNLR
jgi:hypothetical protein